jgi:methyltransferase (TIGR00027 family)
MRKTQVVAPDNSAARVALWRALHVAIDPPPHVLVDEIGLKLLAPGESWRQRPDVNPPRVPSGYRASVVARARFIEELVCEQVARGVAQYLILGAGLDTFAQRRPEIAAALTIYEVDQPGPQEWKRRRLVELGLGIPKWLRLVPVDFEANESWREPLAAAGFDASRSAVVACTGVSMYLTRDVVLTLLREIATFAPGSTLVMTFLLPLELIDPLERPQHQAARENARSSGTPLLSFFSPPEMQALAVDAGFKQVLHSSSIADLTQSYFSDRKDGLRPSSAESVLVAMT